MKPIPEKNIVFFRASEAQPLAELVRNQIPSGPLEDLISFGAVYVNQSRTLDPKTHVTEGELIRIHTQPKRFPISKNFKENLIQFENEDFVVIDKPSGLPTHATLDNYKENLIFQVKVQLGLCIYPTHRLDVPTSGLLVLAKNLKFHQRFQKLLQQRKVTKIYQTLTETPVPKGIHSHSMDKNEKPPKTCFQSVLKDPSKTLMEAKLEVIDCLPKDLFWQSRVRLLTGRTHQIRAQLSHLGSPLINDPFYGGKEDSSQPFGLRSHEIFFNYSNKKFHFKIKASNDYFPEDAKSFFTP